MKKLLIAFVLGFGIFTVISPVSAEEVEMCKNVSSYGDKEKFNRKLYDICDSAKNQEISAGKWVNTLTNKEKIKLDKAVVIDGEIIIQEDQCDVNTNDSSTESCDSKERIVLEKAKNKYALGYVILKMIENNTEKKYSDLEKEKLFIEAIDYFKQAEKLARKPIIHSGGVLPGPSVEGSGEGYLLDKFLVKFVNGSLVLLFSIGTLILIIGGLMFVFSSGNDEMKTKAKDTIFWGIVGIVIAVMAYAIVKFVVGLDFGF